LPAAAKTANVRSWSGWRRSEQRLTGPVPR